MIELKKDSLEIRAPEVHKRAKFTINFQRTLRIPDDNSEYPLPPGLGCFPLRHVDDFAVRLPEAWSRRGGVMLPMYQSEAMWLNFSGRYPFALKVAAGKVNAVTGEPWSDGLHRDPQDYMVTSRQPWLDGYSVSKGTVRQFVAMPLGSGYSAEEQLTGKAEFGGLQIVAYPMKAEVWERRFGGPPMATMRASMSLKEGAVMFGAAAPDMALAPGGRMKQKIYEDRFDFSDWDLRHPSRCFVHLANALVWRSITGSEPPSTPATAEEYTRHGMPWFDYYDADGKALAGSEALAGLDSVASLSAKKGEVVLPENSSVNPNNVIELGDGRPVREGIY